MENKIINSKEHLNLNRIREHSNGDCDFLIDIYSEFLLELPKKMTAIEILIQDNKKEEILKICHNLVGIFPMFGMESSLKILLDIKLHLKQKGIDNSIQKKLLKLDLILKDVLLEIEIELTQLT